MTKVAAAAVALCVCSLAHAQFKCTGADGKVTFQQAPCQDAQQRQEAVKPRDNGPREPQAAQPLDSPYKRMNDRLSRENRITDLEREIAGVENGVVQRNRQMAAEMDHLRNTKRYAKNNLAGATWEQSISIEMQAVATKYRTINDAEQERLKLLRAELGSVRASK